MHNRIMSANPLLLKIWLVIATGAFCGRVSARDINICNSQLIYEINLAKDVDDNLTANASTAAASDCHLNVTFTCSGQSSCARSLVLLGKAVVKGNTSQRMRYELHARRYTVSAGLVHGLVLRNSSRIPVYFNSSSKEFLASDLPPELRVLLLKPGYCARDFLLFKNSCYAVSHADRGSLQDALRNVKGNAQLASFSSDDEISRFFAANAARVDVYPYERPLDLSQPVRLAVFYNPADGAVMSPACNSTRSWLHRTSNLTNYQVSANASNGLLCAFLSNASTAPYWKIVFNDCATPARLLARIPMTPEAEIYSRRLRELLAKILRRFPDVQNGTGLVIEQRTKLNETKISGFIFVIKAIFACLIVVAFIALPLGIKMRRQGLNAEPKSPADQQQLQPLTDSAV